MATERLRGACAHRKVRPIRIDGDTAFVPLTRGFEAAIDAADAMLVEGYNWSVLLTKYGHAYAQRTAQIDGKRYAILMHRAVLDAVPGRDVDHIDGDGLNNRRANLRECTHKQNMANAVVSRRSQLGMKGAYADKRGRFRASIEVNRKTIHLGSYDTPEEAAAAYRGAAKLVHGKFAA